ncbi:MAG: ornithine cyclodeaminase family protein [Dehalococcoidaceae bacterium]|nr:ornithine cyclodeaminase family protein [Dehalococcoidaceae bacterium]
MATLILARSDVINLIDMGSVIQSVEGAFRDLYNGLAQMPAKVYIAVEKGDFRAMPAALPGAAGIKWVNVHPDNPCRGMPTVMGLLIYSDPETGYPLAVMDATEITAYRTGAAAAIAARYMARPGSCSLGLVGAGRQAYTQLEAHNEIFSFSEIFVFDIDGGRAEALIKAYPHLPITFKPLETVCSCDIVCTTTPARQPVVKLDMLKPGAHINAVGADACGKQELEPEILQVGRVVVDDPDQSIKAGEINVAVSRGLFQPGQIAATLSQVIAGEKPGRENERQITIFDSTGIAIQDIAVARSVYQKAKHTARGRYLEIPLVD